MTFHGLPPTPKHQTRHLDGSRDNNSRTNLAWGTKKENEDDKLKHGTHGSQLHINAGEKHGSAKLTNEQARQIYNSDKNGVLLADEYQITRATVSKIKTGRTWQHATQHQLN